jgi:hypothetical protein
MIDVGPTWGDPPVTCAATLRPDVDGPTCQSLSLPICTPKQYLTERARVSRANSQFSGGPLDMEEHLAHDFGCKVGMATTANIAPVLPNLIFSFEVLLLFAVIFWVTVGRKAIRAVDHNNDRSNAR